MVSEELSIIIRPAAFNNDKHISAGFSTRRGGISAPPYDTLNLGLSTGDKRENVLENRARVFSEAGFLPELLAIAGQVHGTEVLEVTGPGLFPGFDSLVTQTPGIVLCISAADCAAVLLADAERGIVGACHAGWRGAAERIVERTLMEMNSLGAESERIRAYVSPHICVEHFEVGEDVAARFVTSFVFRFPDKPKPHVDLGAAIVAQLLDAGVLRSFIEVSGDCTFAQTGHFFSHRAENGRTGRMMGFIGMRNT